MITSYAVTHGLRVSSLARFFRAGALRRLRADPKSEATFWGPDVRCYANTDNATEIASVWQNQTR